MSLIKGPTKLELEGVGTLTVRPSDYVTQGGEGAIYRKGNRILKLALDRKKFRLSDAPAKVKLLRNALSHPSIVAPQGLVLDSTQTPIGFHLPYVEGEPYPRVFTTAWQKQQRFGTPEATTLATTMHDVVGHTHHAGALMVDANELNWLADVRDIRRPVPYIIDVDSWQIDRYTANMVMPSIRDWHGAIGETSDWFAWGVVTFLLYTGIHPYKGKLDGYKPGELDRRMKENASVFRPDVKLNHAVRDFAAIPGPLLDWYRATFEDGERTLPPSPQATGVANTTIGRVLRAVATQTGGLRYEEILRVPGADIISVWPCGVVRTSNNELIEISSTRSLTHVSGTRVAVVKRHGGYLIAEVVGGACTFRFVTSRRSEHALSLSLPINGVVRNGDRLFAVTDTELVELTLQAFTRPVLTTGSRWQILGKSTTWLTGIGVSDVLGAMHLVVPYAEDEVAMVRAKELDGLKIIDGIGNGRIATIMTIDATGQYRVFTFAGEKHWRSYGVTVRETDGPELNQAILPKGVTAEISEDGELTVSVPSQGVVKQVTDKDLFTTMQLGNMGDTVVYRHDGALWSLRMT